MTKESIRSSADRRNEIREELRARAADGDGFAGIHIDALPDEDIDIYEKLIQETLSFEEFSRWKDGIFAVEQERQRQENGGPVLERFSDRGNFAAAMANKYGELQLKELLRTNKKDNALS